MELLGSRLLTRASVSKKGEAKRTYEVACQLWRRDAVSTPTLHSVISQLRVWSCLAECVFLKNRKVILFEVSRMWPTWKKRFAASHCPRWNARLLMLPLFHFVDCGLYCAGFEAVIIAQLLLSQRCTSHEHFTRCTAQRVLDEDPHSAHHLITKHSWVSATFHNRIHVWIKQNNVCDCNNT